MKLDLKRYNQTYKNTVEILSEQVNFLDIYAKYFINFVKQSTLELMTALTEKNIAEIKFRYQYELKQLLCLYINKLNILRGKVKVIFKYNDYQNELELFQFVISNEELITQFSNLDEDEIIPNIEMMTKYFIGF